MGDGDPEAATLNLARTPRKTRTGRRLHFGSSWRTITMTRSTTTTPLGDTMQDIYEAPALTVLGTVADLTQGTSSGNALDQAFPDNTPKSQLTFS